MMSAVQDRSDTNDYPRDSGSLVPSRDVDLDSNGSSRLWYPSISKWYNELNKANAIVVLSMCYVNLLNYMDRSTLAGILDSIEHEKSFNIHSDRSVAFLQTAFVISFMLFAPIFGYLGDRYNRTRIVALGISIWCLATFFSSFATNFWVFLFFRALVGIGEASYTTVAISIICDIFVHDERSRVLTIFFFSIPVGTGLGYSVGSSVASWTGNWRWALRVTPFLGIIAVGLMLFVLTEPERGQLELTRHTTSSGLCEDMIALLRNRSYILCCCGFTCVTFTIGALLWWGPEFVYYGARAKCGNRTGCDQITMSEIASKFGLVMTFAGIFGVPIGSAIAQHLRKFIPYGDPFVCACSLLISAPFAYFTFVLARFSLTWCYFFTFVAGILINFIWSIVGDMTMYIVLPTRRSTANAAQILVSHLFGDAASPYLIGLIADIIRPMLIPRNDHGHHPLPSHYNYNATDVFHKFKPTPSDWTSQSFDIEFRSLQYALMICCFVQVMAAVWFFCMTFSIQCDKSKIEQSLAIASSSSVEEIEERNVGNLIDGN